MYRSKKDKSDFVIYITPSDVEVEDGYIQFVSIDFGDVNFCMRIEKRWKDKSRPILIDKFRLPGPIKNEEEKSLLFPKFDFLRDYLNKNSKDICEAHYIILEHQLAKFNTFQLTNMAVVMGILLKIIENCKNKPCILLIDPKCKDHFTKKFEGKDNKERSINFAHYIFTLLDDPISLKRIEKEKKKDDLADVKTQQEAFIEYKQLFNKHKVLKYLKWKQSQSV